MPVEGERGSAAGQDGREPAAAAVPGIPAGPRSGWKKETYPQIAARAAAEGATIYFADEAGIRSGHHAGTTWAPAGQTPVVEVTGARFSVNMVSAVTAKGALRFAVFEGTTTAASFIAFCKRLVHDAPGPVYLIVDGHPCHRAKAVQQYVASTEGRLRLFRLPGYSPELNPGEWVWKNVKNDRIAKEAYAKPSVSKTNDLGSRRSARWSKIIRGGFA